MSTQFLGMYRGSVVNNIDPLQRGRVQVSVPAVFGDGRLAWAERCVGFAGNGVGGFSIPPVGASCWVQFEAGDPDFPVMVGCMWATGESPANGFPQEQVYATQAVRVTVSDLPGGGVTVEVGPPATPTPITVKLGAGGIELSTGASKIALDGVAVSLNSDALKVT